MRILGVIPARYASTRFPAKPLVDIAGKSMIQRVYEQAQQAKLLTKTVVATDDQRIANHVQGFGGRVVMTNPNHPSGTDRCFEALSHQEEAFDAVVNIQGDEPFIAPVQIDLVASLLNSQTELATLAKEITTHEQLVNPNVVKVVISHTGEALYFSRSTIPHVRNTPEKEWLIQHRFYKHIGLYGYRTDVLQKITQLPVSKLERAESLEQLRWLENGFRIKVGETKLETLGIDTPADLENALEHIKSNG